ncbi:MAG: glycosyltransferase [Pseudomonadota bacterium]
MRILYYNWADYRDAAGRGGGVTVYQRTLMVEFARRSGVEATFLCAGLAHSLKPGPPRWERLRNHPDAPGERRFQMIDTLPLSPAHHAFGCPEQVRHALTEAAFARFVEAEGPFDVVHFNSLEGLPAAVLALRSRWPATRFVVALHNYYPFCPQVNLWQSERAHCSDFEHGRACVSCLPVRRDPARLRVAYGAARALERVGLRRGNAGYDQVVQPLARLGAETLRRASDRRRARVAEAVALSEPEPSPSAAAGFAERRAAFVEMLNTYADSVLAVSDRTAEIARGFGICPAHLTVSRIGTDHAELFAKTQPAPRLPAPDGTLGLAFLGYMRRDKGFFFLLNTLEAMAPDLLRRLRLTIAAAPRDPATAARVEALALQLADLRFFKGYRRDELDEILAGVDLGIVPSLWEDNLPQVAIELHARHIPLLTSDRGGARELGNCNRLVFPAGNAAALEARLRGILERGLDLTAYWHGALTPISPATHADALLRLYRSLMR